MKHKLLRIIPVFVSIVTVFSLLPSSTVGAAPSNIYFTPASGSYNTGTSFSTQVRGSSDPIYYQQGSTSGTINFPAGRLRVNSVSTSGSSYPNINVSFNNTAGTVTWSGSAFPSPTSIYFFTINFQTLTAGSAPVTFSSDTNVNHNWYYQINSTNKTNANFTVTTPPPPTCPAGQVGTPPNCTTPPPSGGGGTTPPKPTPTTPTITDTPVPTPTAQPDVAPVQVDAGDLSIKDVVAKVTRQANAVTWSVSLPDASTELALGTSKEKLTVKPTVTKQDDGSYISTMDNLKPGVRYYFTITATAKDNPEKKATFSGAFTTRGYPVKLTVTKDGKKIAGATITIEKQNFKTDKNGELALELTDTTFNASIALPDNKEKKSVTFTVAKKAIPSNGSNPETQSFTFDLTEQKAAETTSGNNLMWPIIGAAGGLGALVLGGLLFLLYRKRKADESAAATVATDAYSWSQETPQAPSAAYAPPEQQVTDLASVEQQYIPETEPQAQNIYEAQPTINEQEQMTEASLAEQQPDYQPGNIQQEVNEQVPQPAEYTTIETAPIIAETTEVPQLEQPEVVIDNPPEEAPPIAEESTVAEQSETSGEEEAVYHPDTGELDIIHGHHSQTVTPPPPLPGEPDITAENLPLPPTDTPEDFSNLPQGRIAT